MIGVCLLLLFLSASHCEDDEDEGPYRGLLIGHFNSYHHQVSGTVYAVDERTVLISDFNYDGAGVDTYFWAGEGPRPGPAGFLVPDQGRTNVLQRYLGQEVRLLLPEGKKLQSLRWLAVYDIASQQTYGDVYIPEDLTPPAPARLPPLQGEGLAGTARSGHLLVEDDKTILITEFHLSPAAGSDLHFWTGRGTQPGPKGILIPDDYGYLEALGPYRGGTVRLFLSGGDSLRDLQWLAIYDVTAHSTLAYVSIPEALNVPASPSRPLPVPPPSLPHCRQLHRDLQLHWEVFGEAVTLELRGAVSPGTYLALGVSGNESRSQMLGADMALLGLDAHGRGFAHDYGATDPARCVSVLGDWRGVCPDTKRGGSDDLQLLAAQSEGGVLLVRYRRGLAAREGGDRSISAQGDTRLVWAVGPLGEGGEPHYHHLYPRDDVAVRFGDPHAQSDCKPLATWRRPPAPAWEVAELSEPSLRAVTATLGPAAGRGAGPLLWYVQGRPAPSLVVRRGLRYRVRVRGGADPHSATRFHPLVVSAGRGGEARVLAGVRETRRGRVGSAAGARCEGAVAPGGDPRRAADFPTFRDFNKTLVWSCEEGEAAELELAPDSSWPDIVYYDSFTQPGMGGVIHVVDRHRRGQSVRSATRRTRAGLVTSLLTGTLLAMFL